MVRGILTHWHCENSFRKSPTPIGYKTGLSTRSTLVFITVLLPLPHADCVPCIIDPVLDARIQYAPPGFTSPMFMITEKWLWHKHTSERSSLCLVMTRAHARLSLGSCNSSISPPPSFTSG